MKTKSIKSVEEFIRISFKVKNPDRTLFRGQSRNWALAPKLARKEFQFGNVLEKETRMFEEFKRRAPLLLNNNQIQGEIDWEWLALAQHHWMATRLLDWSDNPLIALFFAVENPYSPLPDELEEDQNGVVWILEYQDEQRIGTAPESSPFGSESTKIYFPRCVTNRIVNQSGCFTVHYFNEDIGSFVSLESDPNYSEKLTKILIHAKNFTKIRKQLEVLGIHSASVYPDVDGLAKHLTKMESLLSDEQEEAITSIRHKIITRIHGISLIR